MSSILTLSVGEFELVHDVLSLLIGTTGAATLFFLFSQKQVKEQFQPLLLLAGITAAIGCYHGIRLFHSWNEAFELAGNSYTASGHFFHELYRYSDWVLTMPLLLAQLVLVLGLTPKKSESFLKRLIGAALMVVFFAYLGASSLGEHTPLLCWSYWVLGFIPFLYIARILIQELSREALQQAAFPTKFFLKARNLFLASWAFYPLANLLILSTHSFGERGLMTFLIGASVADFVSKCGVSFYVYRIAFLSHKKE